MQTFFKYLHIHGKCISITIQIHDHNSKDTNTKMIPFSARITIFTPWQIIFRAKETPESPISVVESKEKSMKFSCIVVSVKKIINEMKEAFCQKFIRRIPVVDLNAGVTFFKKRLIIIRRRWQHASLCVLKEHYKSDFIVDIQSRKIKLKYKQCSCCLS